MTLPTDERTQFQVDRLAFFSDAVFAIAITLLALNIRTPEVFHATETQLRHTIGGMVPGIIGFLLSFFVVSGYWRSHHRLFRWVCNYNETFVTLNMLLLLSVSFIPCPTAFYANNPNFQTPLIFYALSLALVGVLQYALWRYVTRRPEFLRVGSLPLEIVLIGRRALALPVVCGLAVGFSFVNLWLARWMLILLPVFARLIVIVVRRRARRSEKVLPS